MTGRAMLLPLLRDDALAGDVRRAVEKIEAEATAAAEQRLRTELAEHVEAAVMPLIVGTETEVRAGLVVMRMVFDAIGSAPADDLLSGGSPATPGPTGATANETPPDGSSAPAASPRQGEPVAIDVERLARAIEREIHVDPEHGFPPGVDSRYLANAIADHYDHPAEPVAPDKEGNGECGDPDPVHPGRACTYAANHGGSHANRHFLWDNDHPWRTSSEGVPL